MKIVGGWIEKNGKVEPNDAEQEIEQLISEHLKLLETRDEGWTVYYEDGRDGTRWKLTFNDTSVHGAGSRCLEKIE